MLGLPNELLVIDILSNNLLLQLYWPHSHYKIKECWPLPKLYSHWSVTTVTADIFFGKITLPDCRKSHVVIKNTDQDMLFNEQSLKIT